MKRAALVISTLCVMLILQLQALQPVASGRLASRVELALRIPLAVSLEWNAHDTKAVAAWRTAVERASQFLQDTTNGGAVIAPITVTDNAIGWASADVRVYANNTVIPDATIGGLSPQVISAIGGNPTGPPMAVPTSTSSGGVFSSGMIRLGRTWSHFGPLFGRWTDPDGFRTIVHELGHYAFFLYDEYYGYDAANPTNPRTPADCTSRRYANPIGASPTATPVPDDPLAASVMYWPYSTHKFWNLPAGATPVAADCLQSRQYQVYHLSDWDVITSHYPAMAHSAGAAPAGNPATVTPCPACATPDANRWLLFNPRSMKVADGYLIAATQPLRALHEGVSYPNVPEGVPALPTVEPWNPAAFYPPGALDVLGGSRGDAVRVTFSDSDGHTWQQAVRLNAPAGTAALKPQPPRWYARPTPVVPLIDAQLVLTNARPSVTGALTGTRMSVSGVVITVSNVLTTTPLIVTLHHDTISAVLYEAGRGPQNLLRQQTTTLYLAGAHGSGGGEQYHGFLPLGTPPILDGALYLTPKRFRHENPAVPGHGAWALASFSFSCNSPTNYLEGRAPGDEGGLDSADGEVNVHLTVHGYNDLCVAYSAQVATLRSGQRPLSAVYAVHGSSPLPRGQTVVTLHYDPLLVPAGSQAQILYASLPGTPRRQQVHLGLMTCADSGGGTLAAMAPTTVPADAEYQAVVVPAAPMLGAPTCTASSQWTPTGSMITARYDHTATLFTTGALSGTVLVAGGCCDSSHHDLASAELYNPGTGTWLATGRMITARQQHTATLLPNGQVLVAGGDNNGSVLASAELYNPSTGTWTATGSMSTNRYSHTATLLPTGQVLVAAGCHSNCQADFAAGRCHSDCQADLLASAELYAPRTGTWSRTGTLSTARYVHTATLLPSGNVLVAGGQGASSYLSSAEIYHPLTATWTATGPLTAGRTSHTATLLGDGQVLIAGGCCDITYNKPLADAELYNPSTGAWSTVAAPMAAARYAHTATLLSTGQVLVVGGCSANPCTNALISAEMYDPSTGASMSVGAMTTARERHTATLLPNGQVLAAGGCAVESSGNCTSAVAGAEVYTP